MKEKNRKALPSAAEMAACLRDPSKKVELKKRIDDHYLALRRSVPRPQRNDPNLIKNYSQLMSRLRQEQEDVLEMLDAFSKGDAGNVRKLSSKLTKPLG
jgi:hypothetical protein